MSHTGMEMQKVDRERRAESGEPRLPKYGMGCGNQLARGLVSLSLGPGLPYLNILPDAGTSGNERTCPNMGLNVFAAMITVQVTSPRHVHLYLRRKKTMTVKKPPNKKPTWEQVGFEIAVGG